MEIPMSSKSPDNPVEKFERSFMTCLASLTKEDTLTNVDKDEIKVDVEQTLSHVMEQARKMEVYFLQKRLEIGSQKPELIVKDDINELRMELFRKDELLKKNYEKINHWQSILSDVQPASTGPKTPVSGSIPQGPPSNQPHPSPVSQPMSQGPHTPQSQGPLTPGGGSGRPNTPGSMGRPQTPGSMGGMRMQGTPPNVYSPQMHHQSVGSPQLSHGVPPSQVPSSGGPGSGLQGPLAYLEKSTSGIGMGSNGRP